jgi:hypothetical protein
MSIHAGKSKLDPKAPKPKVVRYHIYHQKSVSSGNYPCCTPPGGFIIFFDKNGNELFKKQYVGNKPPKSEDLQCYTDYDLQMAIYDGYNRSSSYNTF